GAPRRRSQAVPVVVATVVQRTIPYEIDATGTVEPVQSAEARAQVGGLVTAVSFREGDDVSPGQVLFRIDPRPYAPAVERAAAVLARDRAQAVSAQLELARAEALVGEKLISEAEVEQKRATALSLAATARADSAPPPPAPIDL